VEQGAEEAEGDRAPPDHVVAARRVEQAPAQPYACEATQLVAEINDPVERAHVAQAEDLRDQARRRRHGAEPKQPDADGEDDDADRRHRQGDEQRDDDRANDVNAAEHVFLGYPPAEPAGEGTPEHVADCDQHQRRGAEGEAGALVGQIGGQVDRREGDLKAANEKAQRQQHVAPMPRGFGQGLAQGDLCVLAGRRGNGAGHGKRQRYDQRRHGRQDHQR